MPFLTLKHDSFIFKALQSLIKNMNMNKYYLNDPLIFEMGTEGVELFFMDCFVLLQFKTKQIESTPTISFIKHSHCLRDKIEGLGSTTKKTFINSSNQITCQ